jgi:starch phosphorylase
MPRTRSDSRTGKRSKKAARRSSVEPPPPSVPLHPLIEHEAGLDRDSVKRSIATHIEYARGKDQFSVTQLDYFFATARAVRDRMFDRWNQTQQRYYRKDRKRIYYLSLEFLLGRLLEDAMVNVGIQEETRGALEDLEADLGDVIETEPDAGLGNGGLGRLAACFLDSMATLGLAGMGYGIRYEYGIFEQVIHQGRQVEKADNWLAFGYPWEVPRPEQRFVVRFGGRVIQYPNAKGRTVYDWVDTQNVIAMPYDILVPGYRNNVVNTLRLWSAKASHEFDFSYFNQGDYIKAIEDKNATENISRVLYPNDMVLQGMELRLKQEYFFVSATLQDALQRHLKTHPTLDSLPEKAVFQLNDTHPAIAVAELMRLLLDEHGLGWDQAWEITRRSLAYTNHTVLPEALETWPVWLLEQTLPRHTQIVYEINRRFLEEVRSVCPNDEERIRRMSLFSEEGEKRLRMAHLAIVGSFSVNGVSQLHGRILRERVFRDFHELYPEKFHAVTNGITPRRWLLKCNPNLARLISSQIGDGWITDLDELEELVPLAHDKKFGTHWREAKRAAKLRLVDHLAKRDGVTLDPDTIFDVQVKRIHMYKRQLLNVLHVLSLYLEYREKLPTGVPPRTFLFGGKAAPAYDMAKRVIHLINAVARVIGNDTQASQLLRVYFAPSYCVSLAEYIIPAGDISEQISVAGTEASGTGNMKFALNGAVTLGTLDGANVEIAEAVGNENIFIFGMTAEQAKEARARSRKPDELLATDPILQNVIGALRGGVFTQEETEAFRPIVNWLLGPDPYFVLEDFRSYRACHQSVLEAHADTAGWTRRSILNTAHSGRFSSDRSIRDYADRIWKV